ncbi:hypothetical protein PM082_010530 [Marasmius tenuissimus]|nr:hypothetical protein PM082_010530 [Marasmius tenuissimus]
MQTGRPPQSQPPPVKIYNAVYSSVQVYECMVRGIAVMRRRGDSYVNATQILKVAGVDKGRRTKILEKEILPGKHEIVQGGYGKYQGTWIPLDRGRDIAQQYGVLPLLAPLFDFTPSTNSLAALPVSTPNIASSPRPLSASSSYSSLGNAGMPGMLAPPPIMPGSALRLLNQGRAQGLFTPSTSAASIPRAGQSVSPALPHHQPQSPFSATSQTPPPTTQTLKRQRSDGDNDSLATIPDVQMTDVSRTPSVGPQTNGMGEEGQSPVKRLRKELTPPNPERSGPPTAAERPTSGASGKQLSTTPSNEIARVPRFATKPSFPRNLDPTVALKDARRAAVISSIYQADDPRAVLSLLREITPPPTENVAPTEQPIFDIDTILDEQGHTALHLASSLSRKDTVKTLLAEGADVHRGNHLGETPLIRTILSTHSFSAQSLSDLLTMGLARSILTVDTSRKSVLHHILLVAGVKGRAVPARYYLDQIFLWIANKMDGNFACMVDLQDEHGDTALNIAARIGNRAMVKLLLEVGANRTLMNKLGLRPGDFGVESEELGGGPKAEDIASMLRSAPPAPVQKSQDVIADMTSMIQGLAAEFQSEIKVKQDNLDVTQAHLRAATRELSEQRRQIQSWQTKCAELDLITQRMKNLEKAAEEEDMWDWTGRSGAKITPRAPAESREEDKAKGGDVDMDADASGDEDEEVMPPIAPTGESSAFRYRGTSSTLVGGGTDMSDVASLPSFNVDPDPPIPTANTVEALIKLRRMKMWQMRMEELMEERLRGLRGASAEKEYMCRRIVSLCTGVPVDKVEDHFIDTPLSYEALTAPDLTYTLIRPLVEKYGAVQQDGNRSVVFSFLINRIHFSRDKNLTTASVSRSRAELCEILATRILREYGNSMMDLALALTTSWSVYTGADDRLMEMARNEREDLEERVGNAIEIAIVGKAKRFLNSSACQKIIDSIWRYGFLVWVPFHVSTSFNSGKIVYQAQSSHSILSDTYKRNPIHFYDPHKAPLLDHYRLKVPFIRSVLEYVNFLILFVLFVFAVETSERDTLNISEILFMVYAAGFTLEKVAAMQEHGIRVYFKGTWNGFDLAFVTAWCPYAFLRLYGVYHHHKWARSTGVDLLAIIACLMFPRLAFVTLQNNLMVLSLRAMMIQFLALMLIAAFCFCGFLYALWTMSRTDAQYTAGTIAWWMLDLWFGLDASGFEKSTEFHPLMGPALMVTYACLSNTLLLTVLVSILSNTFAKINEDAAAEQMFRRAVSTIEGVKADSLFSYQPPVNLIAVCVMLPLSYILSPRWFHKVNVFTIRLTSFPILLLIALYERQAKLNGTIGFYDTVSAVGVKFVDTLPRTLKRLSLFEGLAGADSDIDAIFDIEDELNTSALDTFMDDIEMSPKTTHTTQRRMSSSQPKPTTATTSNGNTAPTHDRTQPHVHFGSPPAPSSPTQHSIPPRARANSVLNRGVELAQSFTSPLAQIYQPLIVDDVVAADNSFASQQPPVSSSPGNGPSPLVSYGPASRRRLSSLQGLHRRTTSDAHRIVTHNQGLQRSQSQRRPSPSYATGVTQFPSVEEVADKSDDDQGKVLTESPPQIASPLPTVAQVLDDMDTESAQAKFNKRLDKIEQRQERIESLLEKIAGRLSASEK